MTGIGPGSSAMQPARTPATRGSAAPGSAQETGAEGEAGEGPQGGSAALSAAQAYEAKVQDLARETRRVETLITAIKNDGHRADAPHSFCGLCRALAEIARGADG